MAKFSGTNGSHDWSKGSVGNDETQGRGIAVDGSGDVVVTGWVEGTANFGGDDLASSGGATRDIFLAKFSGGI